MVENVNQKLFNNSNPSIWSNEKLFSLRLASDFSFMGTQALFVQLIMVFASFPYSFWVKTGGQIFQNICPIQDSTMIMTISVLALTEAGRNCGDEILFS